jgi:hypothetical protein
MLEKSPDITIPKKCAVTGVFYTGNVGGALCGLDMGGAETDNAHVVSITHLAFGRRVPLARGLDAYQRHRINKLKQQQVVATEVEPTIAWGDWRMTVTVR